MPTRFDTRFETGEILPEEDADIPVDAWSLDELDRFADLDAVRAAWSRTDDAGD